MVARYDALLADNTLRARVAVAARTIGARIGGLIELTALHRRSAIITELPNLLPIIRGRILIALLRIDARAIAVVVAAVRLIVAIGIIRISVIIAICGVVGIVVSVALAVAGIAPPAAATTAAVPPAAVPTSVAGAERPSAAGVTACEAATEPTVAAATKTTAMAAATVAATAVADSLRKGCTAQQKGRGANRRAQKMRMSHCSVLQFQESNDPRGEVERRSKVPSCEICAKCYLRLKRR